MSTSMEKLGTPDPATYTALGSSEVGKAVDSVEDMEDGTRSKGSQNESASETASVKKVAPMISRTSDAGHKSATQLRLENFVGSVDSARRIDMQFHKLTATVAETADAKAETKVILHGVSGVIKAGEMVALMGPSGAGKSTLLNTLGGRFEGKVRGQLKLNGHPMSKKYKKFLGYVLQHDSMLGKLTVFETLTITAQLRLPEEMDERKKVERVEDIIQIMGLDKCRDTLVEMVSGGEKKRTSIANELLMNPSVIFLDEPTSGLDSTSAYSIVSTLRELARKGRTIVCSIHQPSSQMFSMFDRLFLLSAGHLIYDGQVDLATSYLSDLGYVCPMQYNPADFILELCTEAFESETIELKDKAEIKERLIAEWRIRGEQVKRDQSEARRRIQSKTSPPSTMRKTNDGRSTDDHHMNKEHNSTEDHELSADNNEHKNMLDSNNKSENNHLKVSTSSAHGGRGSGSTAGDDDLDVPSILDSEAENNSFANVRKYPVSWYTQFSILFVRGFKVRRGNVFEKLRFIEMGGVGFLGGLIFFRIDRTETNMQDWLGAAFFIQIFTSFSSMFRGISYFPSEASVIKRERQSGAYSLSSYYLSKITSEFPIDVVLPTIMIGIFYWLVGMGDNPGNFILYLLASSVGVFTANAYGTALGCGFTNFNDAMTTLALSGITMMLVGGFYVKDRAIPDWIKWVQYLSHMRWSFLLTLLIIIDDIEFECAAEGKSEFDQCNDGEWSEISGQEMLDEFGTDVEAWFAFMMLAILSLLWHTVAYYFLLQRTQAREMETPEEIDDDEKNGDIGTKSPTKGVKTNE